MVLAIVLVLVVIGSIIFNFLSPWWFTPIASNWGSIDDTLIITFVITGIVFVLVTLFMAYCVYRFRHTEGRKAAYEPENKKLENWLIGLTAIGISIMLAPGLIVWNDYITVPEEATVVEAIGQQWTWTFRYPGKDGKLGTVDIKYISDDNPFGINPNDPNGLDDLLIDDNEMHLEMGKPVKVLLRSLDVLHDFYVPQFRAKMDLVPGLVSYFWLTPTRPGTFEILCAELCGLGHSEMRGLVVVEQQSAYLAWLDQQQSHQSMLAELEVDAEDAADSVIPAPVPENSGQTGSE